MNIYTRTGDDGTTGLFDGSRVRKDDRRVAAYGDVDELNAHIGAAVCLIETAADAAVKALAGRLRDIQHELFTLGAELATPPDTKKAPKVRRIGPDDAARLERWINEAAAETPPLRAFILPGGEASAALLHVCRTVCRRAERSAVALSPEGGVSEAVMIYLNRLSDLLFVWARWVNNRTGAGDVPWEKPD